MSNMPSPQLPSRLWPMLDGTGWVVAGEGDSDGLSWVFGKIFVEETMIVPWIPWMGRKHREDMDKEKEILDSKISKFLVEQELKFWEEPMRKPYPPRHSPQDER